MSAAAVKAIDSVSGEALARLAGKAWDAADTAGKAAMDELVGNLRKLGGLGLVQSVKRGKEAFYSVTDQGREICLAYRDVREACLMPGFSGSAEENARIAELAQLLRTVSGRYDQAARAASTSPL